MSSRFGFDEHKHETPEDRHRRHAQAVQAARGKSFIIGVHDRDWTQGPPLQLVAEWTEMERQVLQYAGLKETRA